MSSTMPRTAHYQQSLPGLHGQVLDQLGADICAGRLAAGSVITLEEIERRYEVSRSVGRETIRVLEAMRLVISRRRVGVVVLPAEEWNLFDPRVIRWRMQSPDRAEQIDALAELRIAVEPEAARLAATRAGAQDAADLVSIASRMWAASEEGDRGAFLELDVQFHSLVLKCSGNPMFRQLESLVSEILTGWLAHGLGPEHPHPSALNLHTAVATAIQKRDPDEAFAVMRDLLVRSALESSGGESSGGESSGGESSGS
ncbi:FadR/GntR family transcriptional regulator [Leifsonia sp. F6_8S_P_1B]|uniref:FadR/GntR family transcriptional regulator n=1 Tax=Leifsonia williamsii TaxID=3035919 RepID=A0ABT8K7W3_9MICO|nr:FadR/GntR family transcriptional regulator [Leifsonia williamsii]MDN4613524.1 FadR/GntR family transcriptional regulator [Leifsonia williamsii]